MEFLSNHLSPCLRPESPQSLVRCGLDTHYLSPYVATSSWINYFVKLKKGKKEQMREREKERNQPTNQQTKQSNIVIEEDIQHWPLASTGTGATHTHDHSNINDVILFYKSWCT